MQGTRRHILTLICDTEPFLPQIPGGDTRLSDGALLTSDSVR